MLRDIFFFSRGASVALFVCSILKTPQFADLHQFFVSTAPEVAPAAAAADFFIARSTSARVTGVVSGIEIDVA